MTSRRLILAATAALLLVLAPAVSSQSLYMTDSIGGITDETTGPPGAFGYPTGPIIFGFPWFVPSPCGPGIFPWPPPGPVGGQAYDSIGDTTFITDGFIVEQYSAAGLPINSWPIAAPLGPVTGLAFDPFTGILYMTDGFGAAGVFPSPPGTCAPGVLAIGPWITGAFAPLSGLTWDPFTASLWTIDLGGVVYIMPPGGPVAPMWAAIPDPVCGILGAAGPPTSISYDTATPNLLTPVPNFYISDGFVTVYTAMLGVPPAPMPFYTTVPCIPPTVPPGSLAAVAYTSHAIPYGVGTDPAGLPPPVMASTGAFVSGPVTPSGPVTIAIFGADPTPGTVGGIFYSLGPPFGVGAAGPPIIGLGGNSIYIAPPFLGPIGPFPLPGGTLTLAGFVPAGIPPGISIFMQWWVAKGSGGFQVTNALEFTTGGI